MEKVNDKKTAAVLVLAFLILMVAIAVNAEALEPKLLWEKKFKYEIDSVDLATEGGDVILSIGKREIILFDMNGNKRFQWGPRIDRVAGGVQISKDGKYFSFYSGYSQKYAEKKKLSGWADDRIHFYSSQTKKELWNIKSAESSPTISPDSSIVIASWMGGEAGFDVYNSEGKNISKYRQKQWAGAPIIFSPDSNYFAVVGDSKQPLMLFKRDGTKLWEKGRHSNIASISDNASYISTYPYSLSRSYVADPQNTHLGTVYDKNGNKVMEGLGILSGDGTKIAMYSPDNISIISLPDKAVLKEIPIRIILPKVSGPFFAVFSHDGRYLVARSDSAIIVFDLAENIKREINASELGKWRYVWVARDGKYLLTRGDNKIYYYQLY